MLIKSLVKLKRIINQEVVQVGGAKWDRSQSIKIRVRNRGLETKLTEEVTLGNLRQLSGNILCTGW
jgi:hypothetical protein